ncbi:MAG TPA: cation:proton antiporter [Thermoleophilaceae bacterium]|nr:cation:proton antiporter [Thermoleophilaceae bacterium]
MGALSHQHDRAFSASLIYMALGVAAAAVMAAIGVDGLHPLENSRLLEWVSEIAIVIALFATGLRLDRPFGTASWAAVWRLLAIAMPLTIGAIALFGVHAMGLPLGAAILLGALLAPTDPVLAGDIGVGPPEEEDEREPSFAITGEAGLNDGLAFPFVFLGLFVLAGGSGWEVEWLAADVLYAVPVGIAIGAAGGYATAALAVRLRDRDLLSPQFDGWMAIPTVLTVYGLAELAGAYGFLAAFAGGVAFRRYERSHDYNQRVHEGVEAVEKFGELSVILLIGSMLTLDGLAEPGLSGWLLIPVLLLAIRPLSVLVALAGSRLDWRERAFVAWFGVRGVGSLYYAAVAAGAGVLGDDARPVIWTVLACIVVSVVVHGISAAPLDRRLSRS